MHQGISRQNYKDKNRLLDNLLGTKIHTATLVLGLAFNPVDMIIQ